MERAIQLLPAGERGGFTGLLKGQVTLDFDHRRRRRIRLTTDQGLDFLLDLPEVKTLRHDDLLLLESGAGIEVIAAPEAVADITCRDQAHLVRIAWHLGNRHLPTELMGAVLRIRQDHVIEEMAGKLGATVTRRDAPFNPEGGAYGRGETHGHDHGHAHGNHDHGPAGHGHAHG